ncbi:hypothetical protein NSK_005552 [Nannochloropsis salina CCMP1776]|uniref:R3H domain-containing protein n=1 Tax=Nannochloropsis salina CCMP1776 TaxID=1027361 RepID=A0A4D9CV52_9STRA|nr:hypothetical protein NSK_005552 [Nannochloropsis salina CCMP1776]|eukprot:TFJ83132.1 hypothetical protein NSK_005552 [Nannochloropsis salina CCMP1776]
MAAVQPRHAAPSTLPSSHPPSSSPGVSEESLVPQEYIEWVDAWLRILLDGRAPALRFPLSLNAAERRAIHARCKPRGLNSKSVGGKKGGKGEGGGGAGDGSRQLWVFWKEEEKRRACEGYVQIPSAASYPSPDLIASLPVLRTDNCVPLSLAFKQSSSPSPPPPPSPAPPFLLTPHPC